MTSPAHQPAVVVLRADGSLGTEDDLNRALAARERLSGEMSGQDFSPTKSPEILSGPKRRAAGTFDPHRVAHEFPDVWSGYIRAHYRSLQDVVQAFGVSEKTARNWWSARTGANGGHVAIAVRRHPETAPRMLFAAE